MTEQEKFQEGLDKLMSNGWSWKGSGSTGVFTTNELVDPVTGKHHVLHVEDGSLKMKEVNE